MSLPQKERSTKALATASLLLAVVPGCALIAGLPDWREATGTSDGGPSGNDGSASGDAHDFVDGSSSLDASGDSPEDTSIPPGTCDLTKPFALPVPMVDINSTETDAFARFTPDERTVYFETTRLGGVSKIFRSIRPDRVSPFSGPVPLPEADLGSTNEFAPTVSPDGLLFYMHVTDGSSAKALYFGTRTTTGTPFDPATAASIPTPARHPYLVSGGMFYSAGAEGGPYNVAYARFNPLTLQMVNFQNPPASGFLAPVVSPDRLTFYGSANGRIWKATRTTDTATFDSPAEVIELNDVAADQFPDWVSPDGCRIYFHRTGSVSGGIEIYKAEKPAK